MYICSTSTYVSVKSIGSTNQAPHPCKTTTLLVQVIDRCVMKKCRTVNLSQETFDHIADLNVGRIQIEYILVSIK